MVRVGVLSYHGSVEEHLFCLDALPDVQSRRVRLPEDLNGLDALILPGGESTTLGRLMRQNGLDTAIRSHHSRGLALWGTCAGLILLARTLSGDESPHLALLDISVSRNAYGSQMDSFVTTLPADFLPPDRLHPQIFIRAPRIDATGPEVQILLRHQGHATAVRQGHILATAFHPELSGDLDFYHYFLRDVAGVFPRSSLSR